MNDLDFTTDARPDDILRIVKPVSTPGGTSGATSAPSGPGRPRTGRDHHLSRRQLRRGHAQADGRVRRHASRATSPRRDFTVNSMALRVPAPHAGGSHRRRRGPHRTRLRTPRDPRSASATIRSGCCARPASRPSSASRSTATGGRDGRATDTLAIVSPERIQAELVRLLQTDDPVRGIRLLVDTGLMQEFLPEIPALRLEIDEHHHHKDVYEHSLTVLRQAIELERERHPDAAPDVPLRLAALLHDIGKPATRRLEPGGGVTFHHHDLKGARLARKRLRSCGSTRDDRPPSSQLIELHLRFFGYAEGAWTDSAVRRYVRDAGRARSPPHPDARRRDDPQQAKAGRLAARLRRHRTPDRRAVRAGGARRHAAGARRQPHPGGAGHPPGREVGEATASCSTCVSTRA